MKMWLLCLSAALAVFYTVFGVTNGASFHIRRSVAVIPHDIYPGFSIKKFQTNNEDVITFRLLETGFSRFFTVLDNGIVMTTSNLSPLINHPVNLLVLEETPNKTATHSLHLYVVDRQNMLSFKQETYDGEIAENSPPGTLVSGLPILEAFGSGVGGRPVTYSIVSGNEDNAFGLQYATINDSRFGVKIASEIPLDHEKEKERMLFIQAADGKGVDKAVAKIRIKILDENDNSPVFKQQVYRFTIDNKIGLVNDTWKRFKIVGAVAAADADGDKIAYRLITPSSIAVIVPQTGEILLIGDPSASVNEDTEWELMVEAHDLRTPSRTSEIPARVWLQFTSPVLGDDHLQSLEESTKTARRREKRRVTRAVRPTKRIEFTEADGETEGRAVFQLEKETERETFKIRDENAWVTVEPNGAVRVKKKWDYEELGPEKTIDFWVTITNNGNGDTDNQRVIIHVKDMNDEAPYFINRPLPMQAVVQLNAPPNTPVFTLQARDPDTDHNIHYFIVRDRTGGRFEVDERSGVVRTRGTDPFQLDMEYVLYVKAEDQNGRVDERRFQATPEERLSIVGGKRAPQFYMPSYEAEIPENQKKDSDIISVKAKSFADREIRYTLKAQGQGAGTFNIGPTSGIVKLAKELDFEDLRQPHVYSLIVTATEDSGGFSTSVELTIRVTDVNDNAPKFELPDYQAHNVDEDIPLGTSILKVKATDSDSGLNAEIEYLVSDDHFNVDVNGIISNNKQLDADNNNAYYEFVVTAKDKGEPSKTGTATVRIYTKNKNDEEPKFSQQVYTPNVDENAGPNTLVTTVVASDKDGDNVRFGFVGGGTTSGQFVIEEITGVIRLHSKAISLDRDKYELNVTALDDGACCVNGDSTIHTSTAVVVVFITDVNDNKPVFKDCGTYYPKVEEGAPNGSPVIKVHAVDEDKGVNGQVKYSIVQQPNQKGTKFTVDEETGEVSTNKVFDREGDDGKFVSVTVKATDQGEPSLEGVCSFTVEITDVNDNPPLFDRQKYVENVKQDASIGTNILRVSASDEDADNNGAIVYTLSAPYNPLDIEYFEIQPESGWIVLKKPLDRETYKLEATAEDKGYPSLKRSVEVQIDVVDRANNPPVWDHVVYGPIYIKENMPVGTKVVSVKASSGIEGNPTVFYRLMPGSTAQTNKMHTFYLQQRTDNGFTWADIKVNHPLDYESIKEYNLTIRVENNGAQQLASEATVYIMLEDVNDEIPLFTEREQETVLEGEPIGTKVTQVNAIDKDGTFPNNQVYYYVVDSPRNEGKDFFEINLQTGEIFTKVVFDREKQGAYALEVEARDGAPSARPNSNGQPNSGGQLDSDQKCLGTPRVAFADDTLQGHRSLAYHRLSSPEPGPNMADAMKNLPSSHLLGTTRSYRLPSNSSLSSTALNRLAKLLNQKSGANLEAPCEEPAPRRLSWERRDRDSPTFYRSSSIDSMVDAVWQSDTNIQHRRLHSPLLNRTERIGSMVSPSLVRRLKGTRAIAELPIGRESNDVEFNQDFQNRSDSIDLGQKGMDFWVDGFRTHNKKKLDKINKINIHLHALFSAVEHGHVEKARTILESTDVDVNSVNSDNLTPLDVAVLTNHRSLAKMLVAFGAQEGNHFQSPEKLGTHLKNLAAEADKKIQDLNGGLLTPDQTLPLNVENNNRASFSIMSHYPASSVTGCHGGGGDADKELLLWERRSKALKKMLLGFDQTRPPDLPFLVAVDVTGTNSVTVRFQGPEHQDSSICTKFKVQWSEYENFDVVAGEHEITDVKCLECCINDLTRGRRYWFRVACGNLKGYGNFRLSTPASVVPSSWRDVQGQDPRFAGRLHQLDEIFADIRNLRPENASEIKDFSDQEKQGETPALQRRNQKKKTTIKQLFTVTGKFQKSLKRGVYLVCLFYHEDRILVTNEDFLPAIEVDETYPSSIYNDMHWFMKVACTWDDVKSLKQDMEKNLTSTTSHFRIKLLQAAQQMQSSLCTQDLGQLYYKPIRDSQGTLVFCTVNYCASPKSISVLNLRWVPISKVQKKVVANEESNVSELLMASLQSQITYHQVSNIKLSRGLYLGYLKMKSSVDLIQIIVPSKTPNVLPHCKVRDNPHVSSDEWEWLKRINSRHKSLENLQGHVKEVRELDMLKGTEHQQIFVEQVANTARRLFSYMDVSLEDAMSHRLYDVEVVDLSPDISFLIIVPPVETSCSVPGQKDILLERGDLMSVPVQVFEMVHLCTYQHDVISRYSRLSCILELDVILAQHSHREAFSSTEVQIAKDRLSKLQELQIQLNGVWKSVRWIMDVITFARDRGTCSNASSYNSLQISTKHTMSNSQSSFNKFQNLQTSSLSSGISNYGVQNIPGVSMKHLLALTKKKESNKKSPNRISKSKCLKENHQYVKCEKRSLLQIPDSPKDPKLLKSNLSRGSWPGPGVESSGNLLESSFSKSEQHLNVVGQEPFAGYYSKYSGSDCSASSHYVTVPSASYSSITSQPCGKSLCAVTDRDVMSNIGNRLPPSKSEDHLLLNQGLRSLKQSKDYRECRTRACSLNPTSVSATNSPLLPQKNIYGSNLVTTDAGSSLSIANTNTSDSLHSISSDESTAAVVSLPVTTPMRSGSGTGSLGSVQHSASLLSLAKPIIPTTGSLNSVNVPKPKIPVTVSLNSLSDKSIKRITSPPTSLMSSGSLLSGNTIPVNINQKPKNLELSASLSNVNVSDVLNQHISSSLPSFNPVIGNAGINNILPNVNPFSVPVNRQRIQSPVKSPIKTVSPIDTVLSSAGSSKRSSIATIDPFIPQEIDLLQHPGLPLDSPTSISSSLTSVSHNTMTSSGSSSTNFSEYPSSIPSSYLSSAPGSTNETEAEEDSEDLGNGVKVPTPSSGVLQVYAAYETGLAAGTSLKLHVTPRTSAREVVDLVVKQLNMAVVLKGKDGPIYSADKLKNFCLVAVIGARERCLRDDFKPLQLQNPWKKGRLYVRQKQDVLAALEHSSRQSAFL